QPFGHDQSRKRPAAHRCFIKCQRHALDCRPQDYLVNTTTIPTPWRSGDLSSIPTQVLDPLTSQPYPNNKIPVNPVATKVMDALFPSPNDPSNTSIASPNFTTNFGGDYIQDGYDGRLAARGRTPNIENRHRF